MNKAFIPFVAIGGILLLCVLYFVSVGNSLVALDESVNTAWAQVENTYQRRADLIPNFVSAVKGYAKHESSVFQAVTEARSRVGQVQVNNPGDLKNFEAAQNQLSSSLSRLLVVAERYPNLKASESFVNLQNTLEGTENRIAVERMRFNEAAQKLNTKIRQFPTSIIAGMKDLKAREYFQSAPGTETAPKVEF
jgi:LemA protein